MTQVIVRNLVPEPSRPPPTPTDAVISDKEVNLLQYIYGVERWNMSYFRFISQILRNVRSIYGVSISSRPIRSSLLSFATGLLLASDLDNYEMQRGEYATRAGRALVLKDASSFDAEEFFTIFFLTLSEYCRCWTYCYELLPASADRSEVREPIGVHVKGLMAVMRHLNSGRKVTPDSASRELWLYAPQFLVHFGSIGESSVVLEVASFYRRELSEVLNERKCSIEESFAQQAGFRLGALANIIDGIVRIFLEQFRGGGRNALQNLAIYEMKEYGYYLDKVIMALPYPSLEDWVCFELCHASLSSFKILSQINPESPPGRGNNEAGNFIWANTLMTSVFRFHGKIAQMSLKMPRFCERRLCCAVGIAALILPAIDEVKGSTL